MGFLGRFLGGMSWMGYVITFLITIVMALAAAVAWLNHGKDKAEKELAASEQAIMQLVETNVHHNKEIDRLIKEIEECAGKRAAAEQAAIQAELDLHRLTVATEEAARDRAKAIEEDIAASDPRCECVVPPRAARLLIDAACDANRDANCP